MEAVCKSCGRAMRITAIGQPISLKCSGCDKTIFYFDQNAILTPMGRNQEMREPRLMGIGQLFDGMHKEGVIWTIQPLFPPSSSEMVPPSAEPVVAIEPDSVPAAVVEEPKVTPIKKVKRVRV